MATKSELIAKVQKLTRKLADREQDRLDRIQLSKLLGAARAEIKTLKARPAIKETEKVVDRVIIKPNPDDAAEIESLKAENNKLRRENAAQ